jgi:prevent-host-death family protein
MAPLDHQTMKSVPAKSAKNRFGYLIDTARQEPVLIEKHGRPVVVVISIERYQRLISDPSQTNSEEAG